MIPLRSTERVYAPAVITGILIAVNTIVFLYEETLSQAGMERLVMTWGIVPDRLQIATLFTSMFLHAGWLHLIGNMLYLWVFGRNIEDLIGPAKFLVFYILCGLASAVVHVIFNAYSPLPTIGASGAIAGVMGASSRWCCFFSSSPRWIFRRRCCCCSGSRCSFSAVSDPLDRPITPAAERLGSRISEGFWRECC
jgi:membrane associated rhomboid family serine protease